MLAKNKLADETFSDKVKFVVTGILPGAVLSYKRVAEKAGNPKAARAVARIMSANYDKRIPCHRVIRSDGQVGEYNRGGQEMKLHLLLKEGWIRHK